MMIEGHVPPSVPDSNRWVIGSNETRDDLGVLGQCVPAGLDALVLDHDMPNGDGQSVARLNRRECEAPVVFLSGYDTECFRSIVMQLPDVYYLKKPVASERLESLLHQVLPASVAAQ